MKENIFNILKNLPQGIDEVEQGEWIADKFTELFPGFAIKPLCGYDQYELSFNKPNGRHYTLQIGCIVDGWKCWENHLQDKPLNNFFDWIKKNS